MAFKPFSTAATAAALKKMITNTPEGVKLAVQGILEQMTNDAKSNAKFNDITGNLRDSIGNIVLHKTTSKNIPSADGGFTIDKRGTEEIIGILYAGMEYGIAVELRDNKDVLGDTVKKWLPRINKILGDDIRTRGTYQRDFEKGNK